MFITETIFFWLGAKRGGERLPLLILVQKISRTRNTYVKGTLSFVIIDEVSPDMEWKSWYCGGVDKSYEMIRWLYNQEWERVSQPTGPDTSRPDLSTITGKMTMDIPISDGESLKKSGNLIIFNFVMQFEALHLEYIFDFKQIKWFKQGASMCIVAAQC